MHAQFLVYLGLKYTGKRSNDDDDNGDNDDDSDRLWRL